MTYGHIVFIFDDETKIICELGAMFKGIKHNGRRPVKAEILIHNEINFNTLTMLSNEILSSLKKRSKYEDISLIVIKELNWVHYQQQ